MWDVPCYVSTSHITAICVRVHLLLSQASAKQLNDKSAKAKAGALLLLQQLVAVQSDSMQSQIGLLLPALIAILKVRANGWGSPLRVLKHASEIRPTGCSNLQNVMLAAVHCRTRAAQQLQ